MQTLTLNQPLTKKRIPEFFASGAALRSLGFGHISPVPTDLDATKSALIEAETLIRQQEERIRHLEGLALTDELTGVLNRRGFMASLQREISVAQRDRTADGALVMLDLDGFKNINDTFGHNAGDFYLQAVTRALSGFIRTNDFVARLGGDEFAIILTRIDQENSVTRATEIERDFNCQVIEWKGMAIPLRGSFGVSRFNGRTSAEEIMAEADMKLYAHKAERRLKVVPKLTAERV